jgi:putative transposase
LASYSDFFKSKGKNKKKRNPNPSAGCVDSQSVKTVTQGNEVGFDGGKGIDGRKRHILVDTLGLILMVWVTPANWGERRGLKKRLIDYFSGGVKRLRKLWVDKGYSGDELQEWVTKLKKTWKIRLEVVGKKGKGFNLVKQRWVVERTFAWLNNFRRNSKDYEELTCHSESMLEISMISILLRRLY